MTRRYPNVGARRDQFDDVRGANYPGPRGGEYIGERKSRMFLAGPMSGLPHFGHDQFDFYANELRALYSVASPADHDRQMHRDIATWPCYETGDVQAARDQGFDLEEAKWWCLQKVLSADVVALLPGWENSTGVALEKAVAEAIGIPCVHVQDLIDMKGAWSVLDK